MGEELVKGSAAGEASRCGALAAFAGAEYDRVLRFADRTRSMIKNEDRLRAQRINWMLLTEAFLFNAAAYLQSPPSIPSASISSKSHPILVLALAALGMGTAVSTMKEIDFSHKAIRLILSFWDKVSTPEERATLEPVWAGGAEVSNPNNVWDQWLAADYVLPRIVLIAWVIFAAVAFSPLSGWL